MGISNLLTPMCAEVDIVVEGDGVIGTRVEEGDSAVGGRDDPGGGGEELGDEEKDRKDIDLIGNC